MVLPINNAEMYGLNESSLITNVTPADYSSCTSYMEAAFQCMQECEINWNTLNERLAMNELAYLQENGREIVYEEEAKQNLIQKGIELVKSWLSKILGVLKKFAAEISARVANMTKTLGNKKLTADATWPADAKVNDYDYNKAAAAIKSLSFINFKGDFSTNEDLHGQADLVDSGIYSTVQTWTGEKGATASVKQIKDKVLGSKVDITGTGTYSAANVIAVITKFSDGIKAVNDDAARAKQTANEMIKSLKAIKPSRKEMKDDDAKNGEAKVIHAALSNITKINALNTTLVTAKLNILVGQLNLNKKIASIFLKNSKKKEDKKDEKKPESKNEGALEDILGFKLV